MGHRESAERTLTNAYQYARGPDVGHVLAGIAVAQALLAIHDLIVEELAKEEAGYGK